MWSLHDLSVSALVYHRHSGFLPRSKEMQVTLSSMNVSTAGCLFLYVSHLMNWTPIWGEPLLLPCNSWDGLKPTSVQQRISIHTQGMDGRMILETYKETKDRNNKSQPPPHLKNSMLVCVGCILYMLWPEVKNPWSTCACLRKLDPAVQHQLVAVTMSEQLHLQCVIVHAANCKCLHLWLPLRLFCSLGLICLFWFMLLALMIAADMLVGCIYATSIFICEPCNTYEPFNVL